MMMLPCQFSKFISVWYIDNRGVFGARIEVTEVSSTGIEVVPNLPECRILVLKSYRTPRSVEYRYRVRAEPYRSVRYGSEAVPNHFGRVKKSQYTLTEVSGTGIEVIPNLLKCWVPVLMSYRTYRSVRYRC